jgi:hypothetical protein
MGTVSDPVPVTGLAPNFSPLPRMAPPPFGSWIEGARTCPSEAGVSSALVISPRGCWAIMAQSTYLSTQYDTGCLADGPV